MNDQSIREQPHYELTAVCPAELTDEDLESCLALIAQGGAVSVDSARRELRLGRDLVIVRHESAIVGVGAIKRPRPEYAAGIGAPRKSGWQFDKNMPELGYVAVDERHRGHGLSHRIVQKLLSESSGPVFATTSNDRMKKTLKAGGFRCRGREWSGKTGRRLSLWIRDPAQQQP